MDIWAVFSSSFGLITWFFYFNLLLWWITLIDFNVNPISHSWVFSSWATIFMCWDSPLFFLLLTILVEFWNQGYTNFTKGVGKCFLFLFSGRVCIHFISSLKYVIIERLAEFSGKELDFCLPTPEAAESKLKLPGIFSNTGKCPQAALGLSDFPYLFGIRLSLRMCLTVPYNFVNLSMFKRKLKIFNSFFASFHVCIFICFKVQGR